MAFSSISEVECKGTYECHSGSYCNNGKCVRQPGADDGSAGPNPGSCDLPPVIILPCGEAGGGCDEPGCGKAGSTVNGEKSSCEEVEEDPDDGFFVACDPYADEYYKAYGTLPNGGVGYSELNICGECETCEYTIDFFCEPIDEFDFDASCKCLGGSDYCKKQNGNCQECDEEAGDCYKKCEGCVVECEEFFVCPCDKNRTQYKAIGQYAACRRAVSYGPGGTCWQTVANKVESFCEKRYPCGSKAPCYNNCRTLQSTSGSPCNGFDKEGQRCNDRGTIRNEATGVVIYLAEVCDYDGRFCGCNADPGSPNYIECSLCLQCNKTTGECDDLGKCPGYVFSPDTRLTPVFRYENNVSPTSCYSCDPWLAAKQRTEGVDCPPPSSFVDEDWRGGRFWNGNYRQYVNTYDFDRTTSGVYQASYSFNTSWTTVCRENAYASWLKRSDSHFSVKVGLVGVVIWQSIGSQNYQVGDTIEEWQVEYTWKKDIFGWQAIYDGWLFTNTGNRPSQREETASISRIDSYKSPDDRFSGGMPPRSDEDWDELLVSIRKISLISVR